jgi:hypothetical protein
MQRCAAHNLQPRSMVIAFSSGCQKLKTYPSVHGGYLDGIWNDIGCHPLFDGHDLTEWNNKLHDHVQFFLFTNGTGKDAN